MGPDIWGRLSQIKPGSLGYRLVQILALLFSGKFLRIFILFLALYTSTFCLFGRERNIWELLQDHKIHALLWATITSIMAGGFINQFYDKEKDRLARPIRSRVQQFVSQSYYFYFYIFLNVFSIALAAWASWRIVIFVAFYQFLLWFYSHKLSKILWVNNLSYVIISLYPFFGAVVYYRTFDALIFLLGAFLFLCLLILDMVKDIFTKRADESYGYQTLPIFFGIKNTLSIVFYALVINAFFGMYLGWRLEGVLSLYFYFAAGVHCLMALMLRREFSLKKGMWLTLIYRILILLGVVSIFFSRF